MKTRRRKGRIQENGTVKNDLVPLDMSLVEDAIWVINPKVTTLRQERTRDGMWKSWYEHRVGRLTARYYSGIPTAMAMITLAVLMWLSMTRGWAREVFIHLSDILRALGLADTGGNRAMIERHIQIWAGADLEYRDVCHDGIKYDYLRFCPVAEAGWCDEGEWTGYYRFVMGETFMAMNRRREALHINLNMRIYPFLGSGYTMRIYEILKKNLTFRTADADGMIRWRIGAMRLMQEKLSAKIPLKELKRNVQKSLGVLKAAADWNVQFRTEGTKEKTVFHFTTARRLDWDEIGGETATVPGPKPPEKDPADELVEMIVSALRKTDPAYSEQAARAWKGAVRKLLGNGRTAKEIRSVWTRTKQNGDSGSGYYARAAASARHFGNAFDSLVAWAGSLKKSEGGKTGYREAELLQEMPRWDGDGNLLGPEIGNAPLIMWLALHEKAGNIVTRKINGVYKRFPGPGLPEKAEIVPGKQEKRREETRDRKLLLDKIALAREGRTKNPYQLTDEEDLALREHLERIGRDVPDDPREAKELAVWCVENKNARR